MSKEFEAWYEETYGETVESAEYGHDMGNYNGPPHPFAVRAAESRGIAKGKAEMLRWLHANWSADWGKTICDMEDAILSASQPQEIAGEGCVWVPCEGGYKPACLHGVYSLIEETCPCCGKPIVIGGER